MRRKFFLGTLVCIMVCLSLALCGSASPNENIFSEEADFVEIIVDAPNTLNNLESIYSLRALKSIVGNESEDGNVELLYNANNEAEYILVTAEEGGYAIFHRMTGSLMEAGEFGNSPYTGQTGKKYYFGPSNYVVETSSGAKTDIMRGGEITSDQLTAMHRGMAEIRSLVVERSEVTSYSSMVSSLQIANSKSKDMASTMSDDPVDWGENEFAKGIDVDAFTEVNGSELYKIMEYDSHYGYNSHGSCIFVSTVLLLRYYDMFVAPGLLPNETIPENWISFTESDSIPDIPHWTDENAGLYSCAIDDNDSVYEALHKYLIALEFQGRTANSSNPAEFGSDGYSVTKYNYTLPTCTTVSNNLHTFHNNVETNVFNLVKTSVDDSDPIAISIDYYSENEETNKISLASHTIVAYGYAEIDGERYYKAHMGWENCSSTIVPAYFASGICNALTVQDNHSELHAECSFSVCPSKTLMDTPMTCFASNGHPMLPSGLSHSCNFCDIQTVHSGIGLLDTWQDYTEFLLTYNSEQHRNGIIEACNNDQYHFSACTTCCEFITVETLDALEENWYGQYCILHTMAVSNDLWQLVKAPHSWSTPSHSNGCIIRCMDCGFTKGHATNSYRYEKVNFAKHNKICVYCGETVEEAHKLVQGYIGCILCGFGVGGNVAQGVN